MLLKPLWVSVIVVMVSLISVNSRLFSGEDRWRRWRLDRGSFNGYEWFSSRWSDCLGVSLNRVGLLLVVSLLRWDWSPVVQSSGVKPCSGGDSQWRRSRCGGCDACYPFLVRVQHVSVHAKVLTRGNAWSRSGLLFGHKARLVSFLCLALLFLGFWIYIYIYIYICVVLFISWALTR